MKRTKDVWFTSYLIYKGYAMEGTEEAAPRKLMFKFNIDDAKWKQLKLEFFNSESAQLRQIQERLKDLLY